MSRPESHTLTIRTRRDSDRKDADCSCGQWHMRNAVIADVRESHRDHLQQLLGPDAQEARMEASE